MGIKNFIKNIHDMKILKGQKFDLKRAQKHVWLDAFWTKNRQFEQKKNAIFLPNFFFFGWKTYFKIDFLMGS